MKNEEILKVVEGRHDDLIKILDSNQNLIRAEIGAMSDMINIQLKIIKEKQDLTNGRVLCSEKKIKEIEDKMAIPVWVKNHWKTTAVLLLLLSWILYSVYEVYTIGEIINALK